MAAKKSGAVTVRALGKDDLDQVMATEMAAYAFPWTRGIFEDCLEMDYPGWVAELSDGRLAGHALLTLAVGEAHVLNICVHPDRQGQGIGAALLEAMLAHVRAENAIRMFLEVRASNHAAIRLYEARGFSTVGHRKAYYPATDGREDAVVLCLNF